MHIGLYPTVNVFHLLIKSAIALKQLPLAIQVHTQTHPFFLCLSLSLYMCMYECMYVCMYGWCTCVCVL